MGPHCIAQAGLEYVGSNDSPASASLVAGTYKLLVPLKLLFSGVVSPAWRAGHRPCAAGGQLGPRWAAGRLPRCYRRAYGEGDSGKCSHSASFASFCFSHSYMQMVYVDDNGGGGYYHFAQPFEKSC
jgi:hypothetical protein